MNRKGTDYSKIADRYDENPIRHRIETDPDIGKLLEKSSGDVQILDLACGTGIYIVEQRKIYPTDQIQWHGIDLSDAMLEKARRKLSDIDLLVGNAETLPYDDSFFDLVVCRYAFHHFEDKSAVLKEVARILRPDGIFRMENICPEHMSRSWVYNYFPETKRVDEDRFWNAYAIFDALSECGFEIRININCTIVQLKNMTMTSSSKKLSFATCPSST